MKIGGNLTMKKTVILSLLINLFLSVNFVMAQRKKPADLLIIGGTIVTMDQQRKIIENGGIAVRNGEIVDIDRANLIMREYNGRKIINANKKVIIPGLINTHTHIPMVLFRGIADDMDLQEWLTKYIFPAEAKNVNENFVRIGTRLGLAELVKGGVTTYCDMYYFEDAIADETAKAGVRAILGETLIDFPAPDNKNFEQAIKYTENFIKKWKGHNLITPAVAPHAPYTVSKEHLILARQLSDKFDTPLVIHLAEAETETEFVKKNHEGLRPVEYVAKIGFFNKKTIAAHVIQVLPEEIQILKQYDVGIAHNPQSNMKLAAGIAPILWMLKENLRIGLGTDGAASNNDLNLWEEMDTAAKIHKVFNKDPKAASAEQVFEMATIGGARALHMESQIGSLEKGKKADIVILNFDSLHQTPMYNVYSHLVYATKASDVETVIIDGKIIMMNGRLLTLNENVIKREANLYKQKIIKSLSSQ
jgi:5-methylthioadenosine/S-adenosylhomocysteine deaminase